MTIAERVRRGGTAQMETVEEWRARQSGQGTRGGKSLFRSEDLTFARLALEDAFGSYVDKVSLEALACEEAAEAVRLVRKGIAEPPPPEPVSDRPEDVEAYAAHWESRVPDARSPDMKEKLGLIAQYARAEGRVPTPEEGRYILNHKQGLGTPLEVLRVPRPVAPVERGRFDVARLTKKDLARVEELIEKGKGAEPGSLFEAARKRRAYQQEIDELAASVDRPTPKKRRYLAQAGAVSVPPGVWDDVCDRYLDTVDYATLMTVASTFESGKVPMSNASHLGYPRLENDDTLVIAKGIGAAPWGSMGDVNGHLGSVWQESLSRLNRRGWLSVTEQGTRYGAETRIAYGEKYLKHLDRRPEVGS